jgi:predicted RNA methylase
VLLKRIDDTNTFSMNTLKQGKTVRLGGDAFALGTSITIDPSDKFQLASGGMDHIEDGDVVELIRNDNNNAWRPLLIRGSNIEANKQRKGYKTPNAFHTLKSIYGIFEQPRLNDLSVLKTMLFDEVIVNVSTIKVVLFIDRDAGTFYSDSKQRLIEFDIPDTIAVGKRSMTKRMLTNTAKSVLATLNVDDDDVYHIDTLLTNRPTPSDLKEHGDAYKQVVGIVNATAAVAPTIHEYDRLKQIFDETPSLNLLYSLDDNDESENGKSKLQKFGNEYSGDIVNKGTVDAYRYNNYVKNVSINLASELVHIQRSRSNETMGDAYTKYSTDEYKHGDEKVYLLDIASGKGGDLNKYESIGVTDVLAIEYDMTSVYEFKRRYKKHGSNINVVWVCGDMTKPLRECGRDAHEQMKIDFFLDHVSDAFDIVTCNFAIHYSKAVEGGLDEFKNNIKTYMKPTGVCTYVFNNFSDVTKKSKKASFVYKPVGCVRPLGSVEVKDDGTLDIVNTPTWGEVARNEPVFTKKDMELKNFKSIEVKKDIFVSDISEFHTNPVSKKESGGSYTESDFMKLTRIGVFVSTKNESGWSSVSMIKDVVTNVVNELRPSIRQLYVTTKFEPKVIKANTMYEKFEITNSSVFQSTMPWHIKAFDTFMKTHVPTATTIVDCTANVGVDTVLMARSYPNASIHSVEIKQHEYELINQNVETFGFADRVTTYHDNVYNVVNKSRINADFYYMDPPWGGRNYKNHQKLMLELETPGCAYEPVYDLVNSILDKKLTNTVFMKLPSNFDIGLFTKHVTGVSIHTEKVSNLILIVVKRKGNIVVEDDDEKEEKKEEGHDCHDWTDEDREYMKTGKTEKDACEKNGYKYTKGRGNKKIGCPYRCHCCKPK